MSVTARIALVIALAIILRPAAAQAQAADDHQLIEALLARVQALEAEVKALKDAQARPAEPQPAAPAVPTTPVEMAWGAAWGRRCRFMALRTSTISAPATRSPTARSRSASSISS